ncbi:diguanylate cyclase [Hyphomicrobium sp.]|jgi:diguanylate cyclase (GGDEF)-like protein|uniref:GGDEF domain-containing protein n=1 Tax=Hyphomicrobium sp. TaxID=82 RepID=UPI0035682F77
MILLDYNSLLMALSFCSAGVALTFFVSWFVSQTDRVLMTWALGSAFLVVSILTYSNFISRYSPVMGIVSFSALEVGLVFFLSAACQFRTGVLPFMQMVAVALVASIATTAPMVLGYDGVCYIVFNFAAMLILCATGWEYWRCRAESPLLITTLSTLYVVGGLSFGLCAFALLQRQELVMNRVPDDWAENFNLIVCLVDTAAIGALSLGLNQIRVTRRHKRDAETDSLTGLFNRRAFFDRASDLPTSTTIVAIVFDIDHFKQVNDIHGHQFGDMVLQTFASILSEAVRDGDFAARLGGEEFAVLLPDATLKTSLIVAERVRKKFAERRFLSDDKLFSSSVSVGISKVGDHKTLNDLIVQADAALYVAKRSGRNRVILFSSPESVRRQKEGASPIELDISKGDQANLFGSVAEAARQQSQRKGRLTRRI